MTATATIPFTASSEQRTFSTLRTRPVPPVVCDCRWRTRFGRVVRRYGVMRLARDLQVKDSAIYQWVRGSVSPRPDKAISIITLVRPLGRLRLEDVYAQRNVHFRHEHSSELQLRTAEDEREAVPTSAFMAGVTAGMRTPKNIAGQRKYLAKLHGQRGC